MKVWVDGGLVDAEQAHVSVLDHGFTVGDGVFETLKTVNDPSVGVVPFALDRHLARLTRSAAGLGMRCPIRTTCATRSRPSARPIRSLADGGRLRITLTPGSARWARSATRGQHPGRRLRRPRAMAGGDHPGGCRPGRATSAARWSGLKTTSYAENVIALAHAKRLGAGEALLGNLAGEVCEGTGSNVFVVIDGRITPAL